MWGWGVGDEWNNARLRTGKHDVLSKTSGKIKIKLKKSTTMLQPKREGIALPESLWHLLQVLVSVGFKLHIFKRGRGRRRRRSINTKHEAVSWLVLVWGAKMRVLWWRVEGVFMVTWGQKKQQILFTNYIFVTSLWMVQLKLCKNEHLLFSIAAFRHLVDCLQPQYWKR